MHRVGGGPRRLGVDGGAVDEETRFGRADVEERGRFEHGAEHVLHVVRFGEDGDDGFLECGSVELQQIDQVTEHDGVKRIRVDWWFQRIGF